MAVRTVVAEEPTPAVLCFNCGTYCPVADNAHKVDDSQRRIAELEAQVKLLKKSAADAEHEEARLSREKIGGRRIPPRINTEPVAPPVREPTTPGIMQTRFGFLSRKTSTVDSPSPMSPSDLQAALAKEQQMRQKAEGKVNQLSSEMEDLSAQLFQQANEMVATERKARAKLEERVEILETRDVEKRKRLERLEGALIRIDRVKQLLKT